MHLTFKERLGLASILPEQGTFGTLRTVRRLREALEFTAEEQEKYKLQAVPVPGQVIWSWAPEHKDLKVDVDIDVGGQAFLVAKMKELANSSRLPDVLLDIACELIPEAKG
jgi:hypothetical protein